MEEDIFMKEMASRSVEWRQRAKRNKGLKERKRAKWRERVVFIPARPTSTDRISPSAVVGKHNT